MTRLGTGIPPLRRLELGALFVYGGFGALFSATSRYAHETLGASKGVAGFAVSIFFVAAVFTRPVVGRLIDRYGRRRFLTIPPFLLAALFFAFHFAHSIQLLYLLRFLQGAVGAGFCIAAVAASTDLSPPDRRASAVARLSLAVYMGFAVGPAAGEFLLNRGPALTWTVLGCVCLFGAFVCASLPETLPHRIPDTTYVETTGAASRSASIGPSRASRSTWLHRDAVLPGVAMLALGVGYASITAQAALFARSVQMDSSQGLYAAFAVTVLCIRLTSGRLADRRGNVEVVNAGIVAYIIGFAVLTQAASSVAAYVGVMAVGIGWAFVLPAQTAWLADRVDDHERGAAVGSLVAFMDVGQGLGGYAVGAIADRVGFGWGYSLPLALAVVAGAVMQRVPRPAVVE